MNSPVLELRLKWLVLIALVCAVLWLLGPSLAPFVAAALFAYLFNPLVQRLERRGVSRVVSVSLLFLIMTLALIGIVLVLIPFIENQIANFLEQLPRWTNWAQTVAAPWIERHFGISLGAMDAQGLVGILQGHWKEAGGFATNLIGRVSKSGFAIVGWMLNLVIVPVAAFYLLRDWNIVVERMHSLIPRSVEPTVVRLVRECDDTLGGFLRGQLSVMIVLGVIYGVGLWLVGISVGPLIGMIAGLISFVPYLGAIVGLVMAVIAALVQYQDWFHVGMVLVVFAVGQTLEGYFLVPKLVGDKIGMHPVAVMFAILAGGQIGGFVGVLLALPIAAVAMVLLRYAYERYTQSEMYQDAPDGPQIVVPGDPGAGANPEIVVVAARDIRRAPGDSGDA